MTGVLNVPAFSKKWLTLKLLFIAFIPYFNRSFSLTSFFGQKIVDQQQKTNVFYSA